MKPGCYKMSMAEYQADPCPTASLSRSVIKDLIFGAPIKAKLNHPRLNPNLKQDEDKKFDIGEAAHALLLDGDDVVSVIDARDWRTNKAKEERDTAYADGKVPLLPDQYSEVKEMVDAAHAFLSTVKICLLSDKQGLYIADGDSELSYFWKEGDTWCRIRPDWIDKSRTIILDYKTTAQSAKPEEYANIIVNNGSDIQDAFYRRGVGEIEGTKPDFYFLVQETSSPYLCSLIELDVMFKDMGEAKVKYGLRAWDFCLKRDYWPGYSNELYTLEPKPWSLASWEMRKANGKYV